MPRDDARYLAQQGEALAQALERVANRLARDIGAEGGELAAMARMAVVDCQLLRTRLRAIRRRLEAERSATA